MLDNLIITDMKANTIRQRVISDMILTMFVDNKINTQSDVSLILNKIQSNLNMDLESAKKFFQKAIGK